MYHVITTDAQLREKLRELQVMIDELKLQLTEQERKLKKSDHLLNTGFKRFVRLTTAAIILALAACAGVGLSAVQLNAKVEETTKLLAAFKREREANPQATYEGSVAKVAADHQLKKSQVARDFAFVEMLAATKTYSSPLLVENAAVLKPFSDFNSVLAATALERAEASFKPVDSAKLVLAKREERRNSFSAGIGGPFCFVGDVISGVLGPLKRPPDPLDKLLNNGGLLEPAEVDSPSWSSVVSRAWDETWGVGPGHYRTGFIFGCALILVILREARAGR